MILLELTIMYKRIDNLIILIPSYSLKSHKIDSYELPEKVHMLLFVSTE